MAESNSEGEEKCESYGDVPKIFCLVKMGDGFVKSAVISKTGKNRYKQSYREAWESLKDFKGWLTGVPGNPSKAYCKLCKKELHCHRLSLLKHKVTLKHQNKEAALNIQNEQEESDVKSNEGRTKTNVKHKRTISEEGVVECLPVSESDEGEDEEEDDGEEDVGMVERLDEDPLKTSQVNHDWKSNEDTAMSNRGGPLSTHVLDLTKGLPAAGVQVLLYKLVEGRWTLQHEGFTNANGRYDQFFSESGEFTVSRYKLHFDVDKYFAGLNIDTIFPFVEIVFDVKNASTHYHIPLLLSPYGYNTYRGS